MPDIVVLNDSVNQTYFEEDTEDQIYANQVEAVLPRVKCKYASVRNARALMIEMRAKHGFSDFNKNFAVIKKFMKHNNL